MVKNNFTYTVLFFLCLSTMLWAKKKAPDNTWYTDINGDGKNDTVEAVVFANQVVAYKFYVNGQFCEVNIKQPLNQKSLVNFSPTCEGLYYPEFLFEIPKADSLLNFPKFKKDFGMPGHLSWLIEAYQNYKTYPDDPFIIASTTVTPSEYTDFLIKTLNQGPPTFVYDPSNKYLLGEIPYLQNLGIKNAVLSYFPQELTKAIDIRSYELYPEYPKMVDTLPHKRLLVTGHSIILETKVDKEINYKVLFVSDNLLWKNITQLNYISVLKAKFYKDYVFIIGESGEKMTNYLYIVHTVSGKVFMINPDIYVPEKFKSKRYLNDFEVMEGELFTFIKTAPSYNDLSETFFDLQKLLKYIEKK